MSRPITAPANLPELVRAAFARARSDGELHYFPTQVAILRVGCVPFQLRFSPALANKPGSQAGASAARPRLDPFAQPPRGLFVADLGAEHYLVLNKFAVVPEHFILATRAFKPQTGLLEPSDLAATLACIRAYEDEVGTEAEAAAEPRLFAFFNCGEHSGASQPHRHLQLLPVVRMRDGLDDDAAWDLLVGRPHRHDVPFVCFSEAIDLHTPAPDLHAAYLRLYRRACRAVEGRHGGDPTADAKGEARISYNLAMTSHVLALCPRLAEGGEVSGPGGVPAGRLALNGTLLAGTALVKSEAEWEALRQDPRGLARVLGCIGVPRDHLEDGTLEP